MTNRQNGIGVLVPNILLPKKTADFERWAVVACDQFTSEPDYWERAAAFVGEGPSALRLILPEAHLGADDEAVRIRRIRETMREYLNGGVLCELPAGFVLVTRRTGGRTRTGLVLALDLEAYDFHKGAGTLIRATEGTIESRIPPRLKIRAGAALELPHILVLIDDPEKTVIEPLAERKTDYETLYDTELMLGGGHIEGRFVGDDTSVRQVLDALTRLADADAFHRKYGDGYAPMLFAMGDGNHSFATAKAYWDSIRPSLTAIERETHPARYCLVEIVNVHDAGIVFEPIHRVLFGIGGEAGIRRLQDILSRQNGGCAVVSGAGNAPGGSGHAIPFLTGGLTGTFVVEHPVGQLAVGTLQAAIDELASAAPGVRVDYIHGAEVVRSLSQRDSDTMGFLLPAMRKEELFRTVVYDGALPRKTFSMGSANEKRYYMEARKIGL